MSDEGPTRKEYTRVWDVTVLFKSGETTRFEVKKKSYYEGSASLGIEHIDDNCTTYSIDDADRTVRFCAHTSEIAGVTANLVSETFEMVENPFYKGDGE